MDFLLDRNGDLVVSDLGDLSLVDSIKQAVTVRLRWIYHEWKFAPEYGLPWFEEIFVKNPDVLRIKSIVRNEIVKVAGVNDARVTSVSYDAAARKASFAYSIFVGETEYREELELYG